MSSSFCPSLKSDLFWFEMSSCEKLFAANMSLEGFFSRAPGDLDLVPDLTEVLEDILLFFIVLSSKLTAVLLEKISGLA